MLETSPLEIVTAANSASRSHPPALRGAAVASVGIALPQRRVSNAPIAARLGVEERWIVERTGIHERRIADAGETVADYAEVAARRALESAGVHPREVDLVLLATISHERLTPNGASLVAARIGADGAGAIDLNAACAGFVSGLTLAAGQVESGRARTALVIGADLLSPLTDPDDRRTAALFADAAGAVVVTALEDGGSSRIGPGALGSDGSRGELITAERDELIIHMQGHDTFRQALDRLSESTIEACEMAGLKLGDVDVFAYHQANARILTAVGERLGLDPDRIVNCIDRFGNASAATVPLALADAQEDGRLQPGSRVLLAAFGGGLTWAATVIEWGMEPNDG